MSARSDGQSISSGVSFRHSRHKSGQSGGKISRPLRAMAGLGPQGNGGHTGKEDMDLASFNLQVERAALLIYRLTR